MKGKVLCIKKIVDIFRKRKILKYARYSGYDVDGDIVVYKGSTYYVYILDNVCKRVK